MNKSLCLSAICFLLISAVFAQTAAVQTKSALESEPKGWADLLADKSLKDWTRGALPAVAQLKAGNIDDPSPWSLDPSGKVLISEANKVGREWFRYVPELTNFIIHAEFRHTPIEGETRYNSGLFFRTSADAKVNHQAQMTLGGGFLLGTTPVKGEIARINLQKQMVENRVKPAGEWNVFEIRAVGKQVTLWVNGAVVNEWTECEVPSGHIGLEAEGYRIEFRNLQLKRLP
jgi:hypothetical protein